MIVITDTELENILKELLQKKLKLWINNKTWREGRLILFKQSGFYIEFIIKSKKKDRERFEIPIPFGIESWLEEDVVYFDYQLQTLANKEKNIVRMLKNIEPTGKNKFYDSILEIQIIPDIV